MRLELNIIRDFDHFSRLVRRAMDMARTYGQSTLTLKFTSTKERNSFDVHSEITKPKIEGSSHLINKTNDSLKSKEKCVLEYINKFDNMPVESLELSNRVKIVIGRWLYWHLGHYEGCVISDLKPLIEEQSWKSVRAFGIKAYEELIDALYLKVINSGAWILE